MHVAPPHSWLLSMFAKGSTLCGFTTQSMKLLNTQSRPYTCVELVNTHSPHAASSTSCVWPNSGDLSCMLCTTSRVCKSIQLSPGSPVGTLNEKSNIHCRSCVEARVPGGDQNFSSKFASHVHVLNSMTQATHLVCEYSVICRSQHF